MKIPVLRAYVTWLQTLVRENETSIEDAFNAGFKAGTDAAATCSTIREAFANERALEAQPSQITKEAIEAACAILKERDKGNAINIPDVVAMLTAAFAAMPGAAVKRGIYIASKTKHADRWRFLRDKVGEPIISTWIDEAEDYATLDWPGLWRRCISEASSAEVLIIYREPGEELKGAWVEMGAALTAGASVFAVGIEEFNVAKDARIHHFPDMKAAIATAREARIMAAIEPAPDLAARAYMEGK